MAEATLSSNFPDGDALLSRCEQTLRTYLLRNTWGLVRDADVPVLATRMMQRVQQQQRTEPAPLSTLIEASAVYCFCEVLYHACHAAGTRAQRRAFTDVATYTERIVRTLARQNARTDYDAALSEEVQQEVLLTVYRVVAGNLQALHDPGLFLAWVRRVAYRAFWRVVHQNPATLPLDASGSRGSDVLVTDSTPGSDFDPQFARELEAVLRQCIPKSAIERRVIWLFYVEALAIKEIGRRLSLPATQVSQCKIRAHRKLQRCDAFLALAQRWDE